MSELISLFCALDAVYRHGDIEEADLLRRREAELLHQMGGHRDEAPQEPSRLVLANRKFSMVDLSSELLPDDALVGMFSHGRYDAEPIIKSLDSSVYFQDPNTSTSWWRVWHRLDFEDDIVKSSISEMESDFEERKFCEIGDILHVFGLRLRLSQEDILKKDFKEVVEECKRYIDDLYEARRLEPSDRLNLGRSEWNFGGYKGLGFAGDGDPEIGPLLNEIKAYLYDAKDRALEATFIENSESLLEQMKKDAEAFSRKVTSSHEGDGQFALIPVFSGIAPEKFIEALLETPKSNWKTIGRALSYRYDGVAFHNGLDRELKWIEKIVDIVDDLASKEVDEITASRLRKLFLGDLRANILARKNQLADGD